MLGDELHEWRRKNLFEKVYRAGSRDKLFVIPSNMLLDDDVLEKVISCGIRIKLKEDLG